MQTPAPANMSENEPVLPVRGLSLMMMRDISGGLGMFRYAAKLAWTDIRLRYKGSLLGPLWLTLSFAVMVVAMGIVYARLFQIDLIGYLPYTAISFAIWFSWFSPVVMESCGCFTAARAQIFAAKLPLTVQILRTLIRNSLVLAHVILVPIAVFLWFGITPTPMALWSLVGMAVWVVDGFAVCMVFGSICARYRDIPQIIGAVMQIAFYVTPIIWQPEQIGDDSRWLRLNPLFSLLTIVRAPLLGSMPRAENYIVAILFSLVLIGLALIVFRATRSKIPYWI